MEEEYHGGRYTSLRYRVDIRGYALDCATSTCITALDIRAYHWGTWRSMPGGSCYLLAPMTAVDMRVEIG
jgi:hypothetical protein